MDRQRQDDQEFEFSAQLRELQKTPAPPPSLEQDVAAALRNKGLLSAPRRETPRWWLLAASAAACVLSFFLGGYTLRPHVTSKPADSRPRFMLLLQAFPNIPAPGTPESAPIVAEYSQWAAQLHASGNFVGGEELARTALKISGASGQSVSDQSSEVNGYFLIAAANAQEALDIARTCPHLRHGGNVLVQQIEPTDQRAR